ncbi:MAG: hypothetical protein ACYCPF_06395 [Streptosporangiaceae bacterium]
MIPPRSALRDVASELFFEASEDGSGICCGDANLCKWTSGSRRAVRGAIASLIRMGLLHRDRTARSPGRSGGPGRAAEYSLTVREVDVRMLDAAGYEVEWAAGGVRKFLVARKRSAAQSAHDSAEADGPDPQEWCAAQSAHDSGMVCNEARNGVQPGVHTPKDNHPQGTSSGSSAKNGAPRRGQRTASRRLTPHEDISDEQKFAIVQRAAMLRGWDADEVEFANALAVWQAFIADRKTDEPIADPAAYLYSPQTGRGIFASFEYFEGVLGVTGSEPEEW